MKQEQGERLGAAVTLLSLDRTLPFHGDMGLATEPERSEALMNGLRGAIESNRESFARDSTRLPDLSNAVTRALTEKFGPRAAQQFHDWVAHVFVHTAQDFDLFSNWYQFFGRLQGRPARWSEVALPTRTREEAIERLTIARDVSRLHAADDVMEAQPLSTWDAQMYAIHRLYGEGRSPIEWVLETVRKRRFMAFLNWLCADLNEIERQAFIFSATALRDKIPTFDGAPPFPDPFQSLVSS
jgi:hypothetical protein